MPNRAADRVMCALDFREPDRVPRFFSFWEEFGEAWRRHTGAAPDADILDWCGNDIIIAAADETVWPTRAGEVERDGDTIIERSGWGAVTRRRDDAKFSECIATALPERVDPDTLRFDDPRLDVRYEAATAHAAKYRDRAAVFAKTGGPYLRAAYMRGQEAFLMDIAEDPGWVKAFVERVAEHMAAVGVESIRRFGVQDTGIGIYDDACTIHAPIMGPRAYEELFYPSLCKMVDAYHRAGARKVFHHCDGHVADLLDLWVAAGIDAVHPLEARTGLDPLEVKDRYGGKLAVIGGLDNCRILPRGDRDEIRDHVQHLIHAARGGGMVIAPHSIGPDIAADTMDYVLELLDRYGWYPLPESLGA